MVSRADLYTCQINRKLHMAQFDRVYKYKALFNRKRAVSKQAILDEFEISEATF